jgi:hypothetical protein
MIYSNFSRHGNLDILRRWNCLCPLNERNLLVLLLYSIVPLCLLPQLGPTCTPVLLKPMKHGYVSGYGYGTAVLQFLKN